MENPTWYLQRKKYCRGELYRHYKIPTLNTWLRKLSITHHLRKTGHGWIIHTKHTRKYTHK